MLGKEQMHVLGFPCCPPGALAARVDSCLELIEIHGVFFRVAPSHEPKGISSYMIMVGSSMFFSLGPWGKHVFNHSCHKDNVYLDYLSESALRSISGNGMSLPCAGFILLMTLLCVSPR